ncbi:hypothetical protein [Conexibacter woesei]|uniref:hypothetical protein n=1 Tax=Conexibacter woesei TaxID=191495 RepID=UPI0002EE06A7|nr:hypothetical protein [Conexibacter woesei]
MRAGGVRRDGPGRDRLTGHRDPHGRLAPLRRPRRDPRAGPPVGSAARADRARPPRQLPARDQTAAGLALSPRLGREPELPRLPPARAADFTIDPGRAQRLSVELTDGTGAVARAAFPPLPAPGRPRAKQDLSPRVLLRQLRLPLSAFAGVDLRRVTQVTFVFDGAPRGRLALGSLQLAASQM